MLLPQIPTRAAHYTLLASFLISRTNGTNETAEVLTRLLLQNYNSVLNLPTQASGAYSPL